METLYNEEFNQNFYLIPAGDGNNSILIAKLTTDLLNKFYRSDSNLCYTFYELYPVIYIFNSRV